MENTFRDVNIALANELAKMSEELGVNAWEVIRLANCHPRVNILNPGPGVGGHCIALDPWFLVEKSANAKLIHQGRLNKIEKISGGLNGKSVAIYGVTYKPNIDDVRESPVMHLVDLLKNAGVNVNICDPHAAEKIEGKGIYEAAEGCDILVLGVNHDEFKNVDFAKLTAKMSAKNILDTRNFWSKADVEASGAKYYLLGDGNK